MLDGRSVSTCCKGQAVIALSSGEAEYCGECDIANAWPAEHSHGNSMPVCGSTPQLKLRLGAAEGSDE